MTWPTPKNVTELRGFLGLVTYVRIFIENLSEKEAPLQQLTRKEAEWMWSGDCNQAINQLKKIIGEEIVLKSIEYSPEAGTIQLAVDLSFIAAGAVLSQ